MATFHDLTSAQLKQAIQLREQIEALQAKLASLLSVAPKGKPGDLKSESMQPAAGHHKTGASPKWRFAHVRSPLDTLMDTAPTKKGGLTAAMKARPSAAKKPG